MGCQVALDMQRHTLINKRGQCNEPSSQPSIIWSSVQSHYSSTHTRLLLGHGLWKDITMKEGVSWRHSHRSKGDVTQCIFAYQALYEVFKAINIYSTGLAAH